MNPIYQLLAAAYKSRFVFRTDAEYRKAFGASFETVANNSGSADDMERYYGNLCRAADYNADLSLSSLITDYLEASEFYLSLDWGDRSQMASRRKFCRMLFRLYAAGGRDLTADEIFKFRIKEADERLLKAFFPEGLRKAPAVDVGCILLFVYGLVKPWSERNTRSRDIGEDETRRLLTALHELTVCLKEDFPAIGLIGKPLVFDNWLNMIEEVQREDDLGWATPLRFLLSMKDMTDACLTLTSAVLTREATEDLTGINMNGIWTDDADGGKTRFWIFPDNLMAAFCYQRSGNVWELHPYEMRVRFSDDSDYLDTLLLIAPELNRRLVISPGRMVEDGERYIAYVSFEYEQREDSEEIERLEIDHSVGLFPEWLTWNSWQRLRPDDELYIELRGVLEAVYDPESPHSAVFRNTLPEITDFVNSIVGRDRKYIYLHDVRPGRFSLVEKSPEVFSYEEDSKNKRADKSLFDLDISEQEPLYLLPVRTDGRRYGRIDLDRFAEMLNDAENIREAYVIHTVHTKHPRLMFPTYGVVVGLDMDELKELGVVMKSNR